MNYTPRTDALLAAIPASATPEQALAIVTEGCRQLELENRMLRENSSGNEDPEFLK